MWTTYIIPTITCLVYRLAIYYFFFFKQIGIKKQLIIVLALETRGMNQPFETMWMKAAAGTGSEGKNTKYPPIYYNQAGEGAGSKPSLIQVYSSGIKSFVFFKFQELFNLSPIKRLRLFCIKLNLHCTQKNNGGGVQWFPCHFYFAIDGNEEC